MSNAETSSNQHQKINWYMKPLRKGALASILVPEDGELKKSDGTYRTPDHYKAITDLSAWKEKTDATEIYRTILDYNTNHLKSSSISPFAQSPLVDNIGILGEGAAVEAILEGMYLMGIELRGRHDAKELNAFIQALMHPRGEKVKKVKMIITKEDFQKAIKIITEKKSSSPPGLHFGIWKAIGLDNFLSEIHATMLSLLFNTVSHIHNGNTPFTPCY